ncbi:MAG: serine hydrolase [Chlorogloeopsis fritschii C42_A2020_084]|uniref:serine hydrolase n=1 Tax=Chlorogloeopsis fritschii TaxID=1124 RepID=UPI0019DD33C9|nr:serine hydrolase [Chlorogloeopsis fritschii]MBF2004367.1 serine hydrolase [Chlorogloeopsis fritschii C42_A2020_084]
MDEQRKQSQFSHLAVADEMTAYLQACLANRYFMGSVLVARAGEVLLSAGYGMANLEHNVPNTPQTKFRLGSITKQFTATAILQLQEQGLLEVQDSISNYLPDYPNGKKITIHHLLNHTSGIPNYTEFSSFEQTKKIKVTLNDLITRFSSEPLEFTPGERYQYTNSGYVVLTKIIETVSGYSYADYLQHQILKPLEMFDSGCDRQEVILSHRASGYVFTGETYQNADFIDMSWPSGAGAMYSTIEDLYKWEQGLYTDVVLSEASREMMFTPKVTIRAAEDGKGYYHGYGGIICTHFKRKLLYHGGGIDGFSTRIARYPDEQVSIIVLTNIDPAVATPVVAIANDLAAILFDEPYQLPKKRQAIALDPAIYDAYVGQYELEPGWVMIVTKECDRIFAQSAGQERVELFPESSTKFFMKVIDAQCTFVVDETGKASHVILHQGGRERVATRMY